MMNSSDFAVNPYYANGSFTFPIHILPFGFAVLVGGFVASFGNVMILVAYWKVEEFRKHKCNILICNLALTDLLSSVHFVVVGTLAILGSLLDTKYLIMTNQRCFYICTSAVFSFNAGSFMILAVGIDRTIATVWPVYYKILSRHYIVALISFSWLLGSVNFVLGFLYKNPNVLVPACILPTALAGFAHEFWNKSNLLIVVLVIVTYTIAYKKLERPNGSSVSVRRRSSSLGTGAFGAYFRDNQMYRRNERLLNSLILVVVVYVASWAATMMAIFLVTSFKAKFPIVFHVSMYVGVLANVNVGCNFFIYCYRSDEYRHEIRKLFNRNYNTEPKLSTSENKVLLNDSSKDINSVYDRRRCVSLQSVK